MIHIYCGDGKGKTTAGMGLCLRAAGAGTGDWCSRGICQCGGVQGAVYADRHSLDYCSGKKGWQQYCGGHMQCLIIL